MTAPDQPEHDSLLTTEGVDEGSAASTAESAASGAEPAAHDAPAAGGPAADTDPAPPDDMDSDASRAAREQRGPGQQLEAGEG